MRYVAFQNRTEYHFGTKYTTLQRWRGSFGAFATDPTNGWSMGIIDSDVPAGPYVLDEAVQGVAVKEYFVQAGVPAEQVAAVEATFMVGGSEPVNAPAPSSPPVLLGINSILRRAVKGIRVVESLAWARMTTSGDVDAEWVFWPPIDSTIVSSASVFATAMIDSNARAAFLHSMPGIVYRDDGVVIHHSDSSIHGTPTAYVSYDVVLGADLSAGERHFDSYGVEFRLPQELRVSAHSQR